MEIILSPTIQIIISLLAAAFIVYSLYIRTNSLYGYLIFIDPKDELIREFNLYYRRRRAVSIPPDPPILGIKTIKARSLKKAERPEGVHGVQVEITFQNPDHPPASLILVEGQPQQFRKGLNTRVVYHLGTWEEETFIE